MAFCSEKNHLHFGELGGGGKGGNGTLKVKKVLNELWIPSWVLSSKALRFQIKCMGCPLCQTAWALQTMQS